MSIIPSALLCSTLSLLLVYFTSPTLHLAHTNSLTPPAALADAVFVGFTTILLLSRLEPLWIAQHRSFPYSGQPEWLFGREAFDFQLLAFEIFHQQRSSRIVHTGTILSAGFLWGLVVRVTFGMAGRWVLALVLVGQCFSYADWGVGATVGVVQGMYLAAGEVILRCAQASDGWDELWVLNAAKTALLVCTLLQVGNHAFEPLPPAYHRSVEMFDDGFGVPGYSLIRSDPLGALRMSALGLCQETMAGSPGMFLNTILYRLMWKAGYRPAGLLGVDEARRCAAVVIEGGWQANEMTARVYVWATRGLGKEVSAMVAVDRMEG